ncbi:MAG: hypothetical protein IIC99_12065, partial [Chloroflexi bacterium]|nr:hypothetical protein [Chloroflexota bacterium]
RALEHAPRLRGYMGGFEDQTGPWSGIEPRRGSLDGPDPIMAGNTSLEAVWPQILAQVDDLAKLIGELAEMMDGVQSALPRGFGPGGFSPSGGSSRLEVDQVLSALRDAGAPVVHPK